MSGLVGRPRLALPFTVLPSPDSVLLVAGEDFRYSLAAPGLDQWLPSLLEELDGRRTLDELLSLVTEEHRGAAAGLVERLVGERLLVDGPVEDAHVPEAAWLRAEGSGPLVSMLDGVGADEGSPIHVLCQDSLELGRALRFNREQLAAGVPFLWVTTGPMTRGYVSPLFRPDAGPCLSCLVRHFERLSPEPEVYDFLLDADSDPADATGEEPAITPVPFSPAGLEVLAQVARWKAEASAAADAPAALYRLHVLEGDSMELTTHEVFRDPGCTDCAPRR